MKQRLRLNARQNPRPLSLRDETRTAAVPYVDQWRLSIKTLRTTRMPVRKEPGWMRVASITTVAVGIRI